MNVTAHCLYWDNAKELIESHKKVTKHFDIPVIYDNIDKIFSTYDKALPTFHISSPKNGWGVNFKDNCSHSDYISYDDYPHHIHTFSKSVRLDVEAKHKNDAIFAIHNFL